MNIETFFAIVSICICLLTLVVIMRHFPRRILRRRRNRTIEESMENVLNTITVLEGRVDDKLTDLAERVISLERFAQGLQINKEDK